MEWGERKTVKKGKIGEAIVKKYLVDMGYIPYSPDCDGAHPFDNLCASRDKKTIFIADSKAKPARTYYPDTGINISHYREYKDISEKHNLEVFIFFVDEDSKTIYGNFMSELEKPIEIQYGVYTYKYPMEQKGIHYWALASMKQIGFLNDKEVEELRKLSTRNSAYIVGD